MENFVPTHKITFTPAKGERITWVVMLFEDTPGEGGPAYDAEEWDVASNASWTYDPKDGWLCEGQVTPGGTNGTVEVEEITEDLPSREPEGDAP